MYNFNYCFIPTDQTKRGRYEYCIIHCSDDDSSLIKPKDLDSWKTLLTAATIRNHRPLLDLADHTNEGEIPPVSYHRKCRSIFTMKRDLEQISQKTVAGEDIPESNDESGEQRPRRQEPSTSRTYAQICIFVRRKRDIRKEQDREIL